MTNKELIRANLPHLYGYPWYEWAWNFFKSTNRMNLLVAGNQLSKSSTQIRKAIDWCTNTKRWPHLWPNNPYPRNMWYLYPDSKVATIELETKWIPEFLPRGPFKDHPVFGWKAVYEKKRIEKIVWNSGVQLHFKTYMQNPSSLQSSTVHAIFCFPRGTEILTRDGVRCISTIRVGEEVMTHRGWRRVRKCHSAGVKQVVTRKFDNGVELTGTPDHPVWTTSGWVGLGQLTKNHVCYSIPEWRMVLIKRLFALRVACTSGFQKARTLGVGITSAIMNPSSCMLPFGNLRTVGAAPRAMWSITKTTTHSTIALKTSSSCHGQSTPPTINSKSGNHATTTSLNASDVGKISNPGRLSARFLDFAVKIVGESAKRADALFAKLISRLAWTYRPAHAQTLADTSYREELVYNLDVEDAHTYFSQSLLVHNCDEELPESIYDELQFRLAGTDGYFHMVFTATLGQEMWWRAMEGEGAQEKFPDAFKQQVSMYDCQRYMDGSLGAFNKGRISKIIKTCKSDNEVKKRVYGRFVSDEGLKYPAFDPSRHFVEPFPIEPGKWHLYGGVDPGTGGGVGHPAGMGIIAVRPDYRRAYICRGRRMDGIDSTSSDILAAFREMRGRWTLRNQFYDQASRDFHIVASRAGESFTKSEKSHELGEDIVNTLFKNDMLYIFDTSELRKLGQELVTLRSDVVKRSAADDFIDGALRYPCTGIPWDWTCLAGEETEEEKFRKATEIKPFTEEQYMEWVDEQRRGQVKKSGNDKEEDWGNEIDFWNDCYGG